MSSGYGANSLWTVKEDLIKKLCPVEFTAFQDALKKAEIEFEQIAQEYEMGSQIDLPIDEAFDALCKAFEKATQTEHGDGLELFLGFHDQNESGDRHDDVDGAFWWVEGVQQLTPAAQKVHKSLNYCHFVTFG